MIELNRWYQDDCTMGRLTIDDFQCFTLELPWLDNEKNKSCVPPGTYEYFLRQSPSNGLVLELRDVEDRTYVQIHSGNFTYQILGCILVGDSIRWLDSDKIPDVTNSKNTLKKLLAVAGATGHIIIN